MVSLAPIVSSLQEAAHRPMIERGWSKLRRGHYLLPISEYAFLTATLELTSYSSQGWVAVDWIMGVCHESLEKLRGSLLGVEFKRRDPRCMTIIHGLALAPELTGRGLSELIEEVFSFRIGVDMDSFLARFFEFFDSTLVPGTRRYADLRTYVAALRERHLDLAGKREQRALVGLYLLGEYREFDEQYRNGLNLLQARQPQKVEKYEMVAAGLRSMITDIEDSIPE